MGTPTKAIAFPGTKFQRGDGAEPEVFATVGEVTNWGMDESVGDIETTNADSEAKEFIPDLPDGGDVKFETNAVGEDSAQQALHADFAARRTGNYKMIFPDAAGAGATTWDFRAYVKSLGTNGSTGSAFKMSVTLKVSGKPTKTWKAAA